MTRRRPVSRALLAGGLALLIGGAFLRMTWSRQREVEQSRARMLGTDFAHRLEVEFQRFSTVSETLALFAAGPDCASLQPSFRRLLRQFPSIRGVRRQRGDERCETLDPRFALGRETSERGRLADEAPGKALTTVQGPYVTPAGSKVALVEHRLPREAESDEGPSETITLVIDLVQAMAASGVDRLGNAGYLFAFVRSDEDAAGAPPILGAAELPGERITIDLGLPGQSWTLAIARRGGWYPVGTLAAGIALVLLLSAMAGFSTYGLLLQPEMLRMEVQRRKERLAKAREALHREAAEKAQVQEQLDQELTHDQLTGLHN
ncbi:MAG TPA: hypothetical protein VGR38_10895, partial [Candidatus Polarisedimenticolia bacterium]|nr:hypothetical protein [Candidatus Polarisedimenticolia bacterium]